MSSKILVVDDEKQIRELLRHKLSTLGFEVSTAKNGKEFSGNALQEKPDLIILDIWLKHEMGTDVYDDLLVHGFDPAVPVIFITALVEGYPKRFSLEANSSRKFALFSKPFDFERLASEIRCLLNQEEENHE
ncbi:MAG: response regulator [Candidatus Omnitrophica bacterium]|nr:response regulator [Candidatus Omnitrophota bacterium]